MVTRQTEAEEDYLLDIYEAKVQIAIERWEMAKYKSAEHPSRETEMEEQGTES